MSLYLWINILSIAIPLVVSFHPRLNLYKEWKYIIPAIFLSMIPYLFWDIYFTDHSYWGFNEAYITGIYLFHLPIEEILFFICIPYACIFTHYAFIELWKLKGLNNKTTTLLTIFLLLLLLLTIIIYSEKAYTFVNAIFAFSILSLTYIADKKLLQKYYISFLFMLIPFFLVNGILTGSGIEGEVVWYDNAQNLGIRIGSIPIEDTVYGFSLILLNLLVYNLIKHLLLRKKVPLQVSHTEN